MNKKIAIKGGDSYNDRKIIKFLESLGGINSSDLSGTYNFAYYYINKENIIDHSTTFPKGYTEIISLKDYQEQIIKKTINYSDI